MLFTYFAQQILSFLSSHRDTVVLLLKADIEQIAISTLEEMHLLTILCTGVLSLIPRKDLVSFTLAHAKRKHIQTLGYTKLGFRSYPFSHFGLSCALPEEFCLVGRHQTRDRW